VEAAAQFHQVLVEVATVQRDGDRAMAVQRISSSRPAGADALLAQAIHQPARWNCARR